MLMSFARISFVYDGVSSTRSCRDTSVAVEQAKTILKEELDHLMSLQLWSKLESSAPSISKYKYKAIYRQGSIVVIPSACLGVRV